MSDFKREQMELRQAAADRAIDSWGARAIAAEERAEAAERDVRRLREAIAPFASAFTDAKAALTETASRRLVVYVATDFVTGDDYRRAAYTYKATTPPAFAS